METPNEQAVNELFNKREEMSVKIRRTKREEIFRKVRTADSNPDTFNTEHVNIFNNASEGKNMI